MTFSSKLNSLLAERDMSPVDLSRKTGISKQAISRYLSGGEPVWAFAVIIADALDVSLDTLAERNVADSKTVVEIIETCNQLNHKGQRKVLDYSQDLVNTRRYSGSDEMGTVEGREDLEIRAAESA